MLFQPFTYYIKIYIRIFIEILIWPFPMYLHRALIIYWYGCFLCILSAVIGKPLDSLRLSMGWFRFTTVPWFDIMTWLYIWLGIANKRNEMPSASAPNLWLSLKLTPQLPFLHQNTSNTAMRTVRQYCWTTCGIRRSSLDIQSLYFNDVHVQQPSAPRRAEGLNRALLLGSTKLNERAVGTHWMWHWWHHSKWFVIWNTSLLPKASAFQPFVDLCASMPWIGKLCSVPWHPAGFEVTLHL